MTDPDSPTTRITEPTLVEPGPDPGIADLQARLARLEAENAELAARLDTPPTPIPGRRRWRGLLATVLILLGSLLVPVSVVGGWAKVTLTDTDAFVATYAPLARDPAIQAYVTDEVMAAIEERVDIDALIGEVIDGLSEVIDRPNVETALRVLSQPAAQGVRSTIRQAATWVVGSDAFATVWQESLRISHGQAVAALSGSPNTMVTVSGEGLVLQLGPVIDRVRAALLDQGFELAARIPTIDRAIVLVQSDQLLGAQFAYLTAVAAGTWLPLVALGLLVVGVVAAVRRHLATVWAAVGLGLGAALALAAASIGRIVASTTVPASVMPTEVLVLLYDTVVGSVEDIATATVLLAIVVGLVAWFTGPFQAARWLRDRGTAVAAQLRQQADAVGLNTGRVGEWLHRYRHWLQAGVAVIVAAVLFMNRPLGPGLVLTTALIALLGLLVLTLLARPTTDQPQ